MLGAISLRFFAQSGHIDAFRSIVGDSPGQPGGKKGFDINVLNFVGTGDLDGVAVDVNGSLVDCGEPGGKKGNDADLFEVFVNGVPFVSDRLGGGNIQLHPPVGEP
jgi:hypothetical protein